MYESEYFSLSDEQIRKYENAYPAVPVMVELDKMVCWLDANENRRPKNFRRFIVNWLAGTHRYLLAAQLGTQIRESMRKSRVPL